VPQDITIVDVVINGHLILIQGKIKYFVRKCFTKTKYHKFQAIS